MTLVKQELRGDELEPEETFRLKWSRPQRIYMKAISGPRVGQEALFVAGRNRDRLRAHKGSFPDITLNLDPRGSLATAHTHHPLPEVSLPRFVTLVAENAAEMERRSEGSVRVAGPETFDGRSCLELEMTAPWVGDIDTVRPGETLWDVARRHGRVMYVLLHANRDRNWRKAASVRTGDRVWVPRYYAPRVELCVDATSRLPVKAAIYDDAGRLFERYEHRDLAVNVGLTDLDFDPANPGYDF